MVSYRNENRANDLGCEVRCTQRVSLKSQTVQLAVGEEALLAFLSRGGKDYTVNSLCGLTIVTDDVVVLDRSST